MRGNSVGTVYIQMSRDSRFGVSGSEQSANDQAPAGGEPRSPSFQARYLASIMSLFIGDMLSENPKVSYEAWAQRLNAAEVASGQLHIWTHGLYYLCAAKSIAERGRYVEEDLFEQLSEGLKSTEMACLAQAGYFEPEAELIRCLQRFDGEAGSAARKHGAPLASLICLPAVVASATRGVADVLRDYASSWTRHPQMQDLIVRAGLMLSGLYQGLTIEEVTAAEYLQEVPCDAAVRELREQDADEPVRRPIRLLAWALDCAQGAQGVEEALRLANAFCEGANRRWVSMLAGLLSGAASPQVPKPWLSAVRRRDFICQLCLQLLETRRRKQRT